MYYRLIRKRHLGKAALQTLLAIFATVTHVSAQFIPPPPPPVEPPAPVVTDIILSGPVTMNEDVVAEFTCTAKYSDLSSKVVSPVWSDDAAFASINVSGFLTSDDLTENKEVVITATYEGETASLTVSIIDNVPTLLSLSIAGPSAVDEQTNALFTCSGTYSDGSTQPVAAAWNVSSTAATIDANGILTTLDVAVDTDIVIYAQFGGKSANTAVTVTYIPPVLTGILIQGGVAVDEGASIDLDCIALYSDGSSMVVEPAWSENSAAASISSTGLLTAGDVLADQSVTVGASYGGFADTHALLIRYIVPSLESISIAGPATVLEESTGQYTCTAHYSDNTSAQIQPTWSENSAYLSINTSGQISTANVTEDQTESITASYGGKTASYNVTVQYVVPDLVSIVVSGAVIVDEGVQAKYDCTAFYSDDTSGFVTPLWSVDSSNAMIAADGWLTAGNIFEDEEINVTASFEGLSDSLEVSLKFIPPPVTVDEVWIEAVDAMQELTNTAVQCFAAFSDGTTNTVDATWTIVNGPATIEEGVLTAGNFELDGVISISASYGGQNASHDIDVTAVPTTIVYPLEGLDGKAVYAVIYEHANDEWSTNGPFEGSIELEKTDVTQWYWISVVESNTVSGEITEVQANWLHL